MRRLRPHESVDGPDAPTDTALARRAALGDREAFGMVVDRHGPALYRYAVRMLGDHGDAQEAVQDAFLAAWRDLDRFHGDSSLRTWLFSLTAHKSIDIRRRHRPVPIPEEAWPLQVADRSDDPQAIATQTALIDALDSALATLPTRQRSCWLLTQVEELTYAETAEVLSTTPDAVRGLLHRARSTLSERMRPWR